MLYCSLWEILDICRHGLDSKVGLSVTLASSSLRLNVSVAPKIRSTVDVHPTGNRRHRARWLHCQSCRHRATVLRDCKSLQRVTTQTQPGATWPGDTASETCRSAELASANSSGAAGRSKDASVGSGIAAPCAWFQNWYLNTTDAGGLRVTKTSAGTMRACRFGRPFLLDTVWCGVVSLESA